MDCSSIGARTVRDVMRLAAHEAEIPAGTFGAHGDPSEDMDGSHARSAELRYLAQPDLAMRSESTFDEFRVADIMTPAAFSLRPTDTLPELLRFFLRGRIHRALVVEGDRLLGIVTPFDVLRLVDDELANSVR